MRRNPIAIALLGCACAGAPPAPPLPPWWDPGAEVEVVGWTRADGGAYAREVSVTLAKGPGWRRIERTRCTRPGSSAGSWTCSQPKPLTFAEVPGGSLAPVLDLDAPEAARAVRFLRDLASAPDGRVSEADVADIECLAGWDGMIRVQFGSVPGHASVSHGHILIRRSPNGLELAAIRPHWGEGTLGMLDLRCDATPACR